MICWCLSGRRGIIALSLFIQKTGNCRCLQHPAVKLTAGRYVGKDDPVCIVRCQSGLPAVGEVLEPFANPHLVSGWMRGSHTGPLMPVAMKDASPSRFDGPPG